MDSPVRTHGGRRGAHANTTGAHQPRYWKLRGGVARFAIAALGGVLELAGCGGLPSAEKGLIIHWNTTTLTTNTTTTLQVVVNPRLQPDQPLGAAAFKSVSGLGPDYMRWQ